MRNNLGIGKSQYRRPQISLVHNHVVKRISGELNEILRVWVEVDCKCMISAYSREVFMNPLFFQVYCLCLC